MSVLPSSELTRVLEVAARDLGGRVEGIVIIAHDPEVVVVARVLACAGLRLSLPREKSCVAEAIEWAQRVEAFEYVPSVPDGREWWMCYATYRAPGISRRDLLRAEIEHVLEARTDVDPRWYRD